MSYYTKCLLGLSDYNTTEQNITNIANFPLLTRIKGTSLAQHRDIEKYRGKVVLGHPQCRPYSTTSYYNTFFCSPDRNQGPRFKSTLYHTSSPGPGENVARQSKLVLPSVGRRKMRAVCIKTFDIDQGHFLVYVRAENIHFEMGKCILKPVKDSVSVSKVKH